MERLALLHLLDVLDDDTDRPRRSCSACHDARHVLSELAGRR